MKILDKISISSKKQLLLSILIIYLIWVFYQIEFRLFYILLNLEYMGVISLIFFNPKGIKMPLLLICSFLLGFIILDVFEVRSSFPVYYILKPILEKIIFFNDGLYYLLFHFVLYVWFIYLTIRK